MDSIDLAILEVLQQNARTPLKEIAQVINLSQPATSDRLRKLERSGVIAGYSVRLDREACGKPYLCFCMIVFKEHAQQELESFFAFVRAHADILECYCITGAYEYLLKVATGSPRELELLLKTLREKWGVAKSSTFTVLSTIKELPGVPAGGSTGRE